MIQDMREIPANDVLSADVCIVGSGAIGTAIALEFLSTSFKVIVLEGGGSTYEEPSQDPYLSTVVGVPHTGIHEGRARVLGGTTTLWAGQALPLTEWDFEERPWVPYSGWPIDKSVVDSYYPRAEAVMEVNHETYQTPTWPHANHLPPAYDASKIYPLYTQFTLSPDFRDKYKERLEAVPNIRILTHANVLSLEASENADGVTHARVCSFEGKEIAVRARFFIVACGGLESARLLLASDSVEKTGIGNQQDVVGRFFQEHPHFVVDGIKPRNPHQFDLWFNTLIRGHVRYALKVAISPELQKEQRLLNAGGEIFYPTADDDPISAARRVLSVLRGREKADALLPALSQVAKHPGRVINEVWLRAVKNQAVSAGAIPPKFVIGVEQEPNPNSRLYLGEERDSLGVRRAVLDWKVSDAEYRTIEVFLKAVVAEWKRLDVADVDLSKVEWNVVLKDSYHHIGTTRMGTDPKTSVVDADCRVHGYDNLYVAGSSVFPTGGFSNPTLTALALSIRTTDLVKQRLTHAVPI
jgi:choline dehydrogenase-like flavoprotein